MSPTVSRSGAQFVLADLAGGGARQRAELHVLGALEVRQALAAPGDQFFGRGGVIRASARRRPWAPRPIFHRATATIATSATAGWSASTFSTSMEEMFSPPEMTMSFMRSRSSM